MGNFRIRTDLALEARESCELTGSKIRGVRIEQRRDEKREIDTTIVMIETENGAKAMGKPVGTYITIEAPNLSVADEGYHREVAEELAIHLKQFVGEKTETVLVVGLGNRDVTPDALGPNVVNNLCVNRHMIREYGRRAEELEHAREISAIVPGVTAQTGMETLEIIKGVTGQIRPSLVLVIDALAARNTRRLNRTIQITDTGINPGSGVGNHRNAINQETLGIPVVAIGIPTVVDAATIVNDALEEFLVEMDRTEISLQADKIQMIREGISPHLNTMFVTPKDIDETVKRLSYTISEALNLALSEKIQV